MTSQDFDALLDDFRERCDRQLRTWMTQRKQRAIETGTDAIELVETIERLVNSGGKRLRPSLVWFGHAACHGSDEDAAVLMAAACEFLHTYLLIHDDIMDHADTRRGQTTAHIEYRDLHRKREWFGDATDYGASAAILAGDLAWSWAAELAALAVAGMPPERARSLTSRFFGMTEEVIFGQHHEMRIAVRKAASAETLGRALRLKSGCYSVMRPLQLGAHLAKAGEDVVEALSTYGNALGEAFQLVDDLLGMFGDPSSVGKPVGGDLVEGKFTFIIHEALLNASESERQTILDRLGDASLSPELISETCGMIDGLGGRAGVEAMIEERMTVARDALAAASPHLRADGRTFLEGLIRYVVDRQA